MDPTVELSNHAPAKSSCFLMPVVKNAKQVPMPSSTGMVQSSKSRPPTRGKFLISPPTQFISPELESPNGPFEMCNAETTTPPSPTCQSPKRAWDMDTLKHSICAAKTGTGEVRHIIETCTFKPREQAFTTLINMCGQLRDWMKAVEIFEAMQSVRGVKSNMYTYSALIAACSSAGEWIKALEIFDQMKEAAKIDRNCQPNEFTYSSLITACERGGQYEKALEVYDEMVANKVPGDHITFSSVLTACEKSKNWPRAESLLREMHSRGLTGNAVIYSELLLYYAERGDWSKASSMCLAMQTAGQQETTTSSSCTTDSGRKTRMQKKTKQSEMMNNLSSTATTVNSPPASMSPSPKVTPRGIPSPDQDSQDSSSVTPRPPFSAHHHHQSVSNPTASRPPWDMETLKRAICFAKTGTGEVKKAFETCTFRPREQAFTALINMCGRLRDWMKAIEVFEAMKCIRGVTPNTYIYSALIAACSSSGEWEKALGIFETMKANAQVDQGCVPNEVTYSALITACQRGGMFDRALELYNEMIQTGVKPDQITYSSVLAACEKSERWDKVEEILDSMHSQGLCGPLTIYSELISHYADYGAYNKALQVHLAVKMLGHQPDDKMKKALMRALEKAEKYELMLEVFQDLQKSGKAAMDPEIINSVINAQERITQKVVTYEQQQHQHTSSQVLTSTALTPRQIDLRRRNLTNNNANTNTHYHSNEIISSAPMHGPIPSPPSHSPNMTTTMTSTNSSQYQHPCSSSHLMNMSCQNMDLVYEATMHGFRNLNVEASSLGNGAGVKNLPLHHLPNNNNNQTKSSPYRY